jgi:transcriptional regulator with XRE-family HTH domain
MDPALLSKIERGSRLPTSEQITGLSRHLGISEDDLQAQRIAADFLAHYGESHFASQAITVIQEALRRDRPSGK